MEKEIEKLQELLKSDPSNFQARRELSILLAKNGFNEEALSNLQYLEKYFPEDSEILYNLGILYEKVKDLEKAEKTYIKAIEISPQEDFYYNLGEVLVSQEKWNEAIDAFQTVLKTDPQDGNCYFNLGLCYYNKEEKNLAIDCFQKAIELNPKDIYAHFYLGNIYQEDDLINFAIECYKKVLDISPDYSWAYYNLASIAYKNENFEEARDYLLKTIEFNKNDIEAYKLLVKLFVKNNDYEEIITILETKLEDDENGDLYYILGQVYKKVGNLEKYAENLKNALEYKFSLTYPIDAIKRELDKINKNNELDVEEFSEYSSEEDDEEEFSDYDEDQEDEEF